MNEQYSAGEKFTAIVTVAQVFDKYSEYGLCFEVHMVDEAGNELIWYASKEPQIEADRQYRVTGTVKGAAFFGATRVTRCKLTAI